MSSPFLFNRAVCKTVLKEVSTKVKEWAAGVPLPKKKPIAVPVDPDLDAVAEDLAPLLTEFAKLDGYNVWRRGLALPSRHGKLTAPEEGEPQRLPTLLSWILPVRQWAEVESWGEDPETKQPIEKPSHKKGVVDPDYLQWLRDDLKIFDSDGTVKKEFVERYLDSDCLEALDFNLSAGRHKPFIFDAGQHRPPVELIGELQAIHGEVQTRLGSLLIMMGGGK